ncbi:MAG: hypothetical protein EXR95_03445 [Gemmatimonadetes bacterium]|nr:hypothetical protein [Gemmatimonadota bacterium]
MLTRAFLAGLLALGSCRSAAAQAVFPVANGEVLAGVTAVDAQALVVNWLDIELDRDSFRSEAQGALVSALEQLGVEGDDHAANFLFCELKIAGAGNAVVYSWAISYYEFVVGGAHRLQWTTGGIVKVGRASFSGHAAVEECAEGFRREWTRWNPTSGG